ncbi:MAG TPA: DUF4845 domain-containing protein [Gammaproteobacteria bacterium]|nr:DUF4845 domain-containing protein [Gammaproteobacteria bacterium]
MRKHQTGLTMISWVILILMIGFVAMFGFKLVPVYMDYTTINSVLTDVAAKAVTDGNSPAALHSAIEKRFNVNNVSVISADDVKIGSDPQTGATTLTLDYDARTGFVANIDLVAHFHKIYQVSGQPGDN